VTHTTSTVPEISVLTHSLASAAPTAQSLSANRNVWSAALSQAKNES